MNPPEADYKHRISKGGFALLSLFYKIDRSTQSLDPEALEGKLTTGRIHSFNIRPARNALKLL